MFFDLNTNIEKVKDYFVSFNISEDTAYALMKFPDKWVIATSLSEYGINTSKDPETGGYYFFCEYDNLDKLFTAIIETIEANKEMVEKQSLFLSKANELQDIFSKNPLSKLKQLRFVFEPQKKEGKIVTETSEKVSPVEDTNTTEMTRKTKSKNE